MVTIGIPQEDHILWKRIRPATSFPIPGKSLDGGTADFYNCAVCELHRLCIFAPVSADPLSETGC